ncbi:MAG: hypothetical protein ACK4TA_07695 [Saprospiraceae bacterium]
MNSSALAMYLFANITVTAFTIFFFIKVLNTPHKEDELDHEKGLYDHEGPKSFDAT